MIQLIVTGQGDTRHELDVDQSQVIVLNKTFLELTDIEKRKGDYTLSFALPGTPTNDAYFATFGDPSTIGSVWATNYEAKAWVLENSDILIQGSLKLERADFKNNRYVVAVSGVVFTIKYLIGDASMSEIDFSDLAFGPGDIRDTWDGTWNGGHLIFPIHDFGTGYGLYKKVDTGNELIDITVTTHPIILDQLIPSIRLNEILRRMFTGKGLAVSGSWFDEPNVEQIYVQADNPLSSFASQPPLVKTVTDFYDLIVSDSYLTTVWWQGPQYSDWNDGLNEYTAPVDGDYYWVCLMHAQAGVPAITPIEVQWQVNGVAVLTEFFVPGTAYIKGYTVTMVAGDTFRQQVISGAVTTDPKILNAAGGGLNLVSVSNIGGDISPSVYLENYKQIDFLRALAQYLNLIVTMNANGEIRIDTYDYYMTNFGSKKDWSDKVDMNADPVVSPVNGELRNPINLELKHADDILNQDYIRVTGLSYGTYREDTRLPFTKAAADPNKIFAPMPIQQILSSDPAAELLDVWVAKLFSDVDNISYKPPGLQLAYWCGRRTCGQFYTAEAEGVGEIANTSYPFFAPWLVLSGDAYKVQEDTLDLNYTWFSPPSEDMVDTPSTQGIYNRYFREMLRERYTSGVKVVEFTAILDESDMANFSFADKIVININGTNTALRIISITGYSPTRRVPVRIKGVIIFD